MTTRAEDLFVYLGLERGTDGASQQRLRRQEHVRAAVQRRRARRWLADMFRVTGWRVCSRWDEPRLEF